MNLPDTPAWMADAACAEIAGDLWFPEPGTGSGDDARLVCNTICTVKDQCLAFSLADDTLVGIWGGIGTRQRARLRQATT